MYLTSARLKFEVVAKLGKLDAVNAQFVVENEFVNLDLVIVNVLLGLSLTLLGVWVVAESEANSASNKGKRIV